MPRHRSSAFALGLLLLTLMACKEDAGGPADGALADRPSDRLAADVAAPDRAVAADLPAPDRASPDAPALGDNFGLVVPASARACSVNNASPASPTASLEEKCRVTFRPGAYVLRRDQATFDLDLIASVERGAAAKPAALKGATHVVRTLGGTGTDGAYTFSFTQQLEVGGKSASLTFSIGYEMKGGKPVQQVRTIDVKMLSDRVLDLRLASGSSTLHFGPCDYSLYGCAMRRFDLAGGDVLQLRTCGYCPPDWICKAQIGALARAKFVRGSTVVDTDDHFKLSHSYRHHNWGEDSLVVLPSPVQSIGGIYIGTEAYPDHTVYKTATYLDAALKVSQTVAVTKVTTLSSW